MMGTGEVTPPRQLSTARSSHLLLELDAGRQLLRAKHKTVQHHAVYEKLLRQASDLLFALSFKFHYQRQVITINIQQASSEILLQVILVCIPPRLYSHF